MILPRREDAIHANWLYRVLTEIVDDSFLNAHLRFKGGTCAAMRGFIDRFSVDLDFDMPDQTLNDEVCSHLEKVFVRLGLEIRDHSHKVPQYFVRYPGPANERHTLRVDVTTFATKSNRYEPVRLTEIDRIMHCQTIETMFSHKLVAVLDRYEKHGSIAGRDFFDIHTFFLKGFQYSSEIIHERTGLEVGAFFTKLTAFTRDHLTQAVLDEDLNTLISSVEFHRVRGWLKIEVLRFLEEEAIDRGH